MVALKQNNKVLISASGAVQVDSGGNSSKQLHIDFDLQQRNRVFKDANGISQVTDKANNIAFAQSDNAKKPVFNYGTDGIHYASFDGVNDQLEQSNNYSGTKIPSGDFYFEVFFRPSDFTGTEFILSKNLDNTLTYREYELYISGSRVYIRFTSDSGTSQTLNINLLDHSISIGDWVHFAFQRTGDALTLWANGERGAYNAVFFSTIILNVADAPLVLGNILGFGTTFQFEGDIAYFNIEDKAKYPASQTGQVFTPKLPFFYYKRYKPDGNKLIYLNSRFLKNTSINSSDIITNIYEEFENYQFVEPSTGNGSKITSQGFYSEASKGLFLQTNALDWLQNNFTLMFHSKIPTAFTGLRVPLQLGNNAQLQIVYDRNSDGKFDVTYYNGSTFVTTYSTRSFSRDTFLHHCVLINSNTTLYYLINGVLEFTHTITGSMQSFDRISVGNNPAFESNRNSGYIDDLLISKTLELNPATWISGAKKFDPPRRRGLESTITQF